MSHSINKGGVSNGKAKRSGRFNFIDFLLIVIVVLIIATVIYVFAPFSKIRQQMRSEAQIIEYTVEVLNVDKKFLNQIKENDTVIDSVSKNNMGTVTAVDYNTQYTELQYNQATDEGTLATYPTLYERYNIIITVSVTADYLAGSGYSVGNVRLAVGEQLFLRFPDYACEGFCIGLTTT